MPPSSIPRSAFDRSYSHKTTFDSGLLIPIYIDECLPGDTLHLQPSFLARMATPIKPYMDGIHLDCQWWAVPYRLVWENFVRMMGEQFEPGDHTDYTIPQLPSPVAGHQVGTLSDYFGIPVLVGSFNTSSLWHRAYNLIFNEWYRDENLVARAQQNIGDGGDIWQDFPLRRRGKRKDYFSGALPFAQKGDPVTLPLGSSAPVVTAGTGIPLFQQANTSGLALKSTNAAVNLNLDVAPVGALNLSWDTPSLEVDLTGATASTINEMRVALSVQHLLERDARGGTRYIEQNLSHFGVSSEDFRVQRPELLGTGSMQVVPYSVSQQSETDTGTPQGNLAAYAVGTAVGRGFVKTFTEHTLVMGICSIRAELTYQQGLHRMMTRKTRFEFYFPDLAHLGEQAVLSGELYTDATGTPATPTVPGTGDFEIWGYQPRYEEYRHRHSIITGQFRSQFAQSLDVWHLGLDFATRPVLNEAFIEENPPIARIIEVPSEPEFLLDCYFKIKHVRPMPKFATPGLLRF